MFFHYNRNSLFLQWEAIYILKNVTKSCKPTYPALDRAAFLIERACVPRFYPFYCAETAQLFAMMEAALHQQQTNEVNQVEH